MSSIEVRPDNVEAVTNILVEMAAIPLKFISVWNENPYDIDRLLIEKASAIQSIESLMAVLETIGAIDKPRKLW